MQKSLTPVHLCGIGYGVVSEQQLRDKGGSVHQLFLSRNPAESPFTHWWRQLTTPGINCCLQVSGVLSIPECQGFIDAAERLGFQHQGSGGPAAGEAFRDNQRVSVQVRANRGCMAT